VRKLVDHAYLRTKNLLTDHRQQVENLALALLDREVLHKDDVEEILGKRPFEEKKIFTDAEAAAAKAPANGELEKGTSLDTENPSSVEASNNN
jgi:cell division protease FtsH